MLTSVFSTLLLLFFVRLSLGDDDLPLPRMVILGQTGSGKSTLANVLLGESPDCKNCTFVICDSHQSCTKQTSYAVGSWLGSGSVFTVVDTPGFGDSDNEDTELIDEMMGVLHTVIKGANGIILLINGEEERFDASLQQMMREMQALFGEEFWHHTIIGVSHWAYDAQNVAIRNMTGRTEEGFMAEWNQLLRDKFHIEEDLIGVFIDSWSQQPWNINDPLQQEAFKRETGKLWDFVQSKDVFAFRTIEDVMNENQDLKDEVRWLNDVIKHNITELQTQMAALSTAHVKDIKIIRDEHSTDMTSKMDILRNEHSTDMTSKMEILRNETSSDMTSKMEILRNEIRDEMGANMASIRDEMGDLALAPMGTIIAWTPIPNNDSPTPVSLPSGWVECDGELIADEESAWYGEKTPDINGQGLFLRGSPKGKVLTEQDDQVEKLEYEDNWYKPWGCPAGWTQNGTAAGVGTCRDCEDDYYCSRTSQVSGSEGDETRPKNLSVVYIMKIK